MFMPGKPVYTDGGTKNFANPREGMASPLAKKLFLIDGVTAVFFGQDFVTVTKSEDHEWGVLKPEVFAAVMDFYASGEPVISDEAEQVNAGTAIHEDDDEIVAMIKELLETRIRPAVVRFSLKQKVSFVLFSPSQERGPPLLGTLIHTKVQTQLCVF